MGSDPQPEPSDEALVTLVVERDVEAFRLLYDRYARPVYVMAAHTVGPGDAEAVVQETFLRLWHKAHQFNANQGSFKRWFMTIARNQLIDELKRRNRESTRQAVGEIEQLLESAADPASDPGEMAVRREEEITLRHALQQLPVEQRRALVLAYFGGLSQSSIARLLDWPLGTVKKRIRLGLQKLRASLVQREEIGEAPDVPPRGEREL
ncbi:MAG: RNA polymerase sigma factor [Ardenticatenaceae bacterium]